MTRYLHTMFRITDPAKSRAFYEALGFEFRRDMDIVRDGESEATNYFFGVPGQDEELELTFNHDGRTYDLGTGYGHIALAVDDLDDTLARARRSRASSPSASRTGARGRLAAVLRPGPGRLPHRADRPQRSLTEAAKPQVTIYTDGACAGNGTARAPRQPAADVLVARRHRPRRRSSPAESVLRPTSGWRSGRPWRA